MRFSATTRSARNSIAARSTPKASRAIPALKASPPGVAGPAADSDAAARGPAVPALRILNLVLAAALAASTLRIYSRICSRVGAEREEMDRKCANRAAILS